MYEPDTRKTASVFPGYSFAERRGTAWDKTDASCTGVVFSQPLMTGFNSVATVITLSILVISGLQSPNCADLLNFSLEERLLRMQRYAIY